MSTTKGAAGAAAKPLSYAQNLEDYHLWLALGADGPGVYVDIGGGHPVADNVSLWFYERGWQGVVVEPQAALARLYPHVRPRDIVHAGLIGSTNGEADLFVFDRLHGLSTTVASKAEGSRVHGDDFRTERVPMLTLAALCERYGLARIDFLKVDVEGAEADVLSSNDWTRFRPKVVVVEAIDPATNAPSHDAWEPILLAADYRFTLDDTLNRFYVAREWPDVEARLPRVRGDWAAVTHMYEVGKAPDNDAHPDHALARAIVRGFLAGLPMLPPADAARLAAGGQGFAPDGPEAERLAEELATESGRIALGRIACGYDGGQV
ncbi:MAG: FkbM family methyltransferase [Hyphomicrobiaceae bacterium]